jgi:hypothetical protein
MKRLAVYMRGYPLRNVDYQPIRGTRAQAQRIADKEAARKAPVGFWTGVVCDTGEHFNISFGGMPERN